MVSLVQRLTAVNDRMQQLAASFGIPQYAPVLMISGSTQELLVPQPKVLSMTSQEIMSFLSNNVEINKDDRWLEGVSRSYPLEILQDARFLLGASQNPDGSWSGTSARIKHIDTNRLMDYRILVTVQRNR